VVFHSSAVRFRQEDLGVRARGERFDQRTAVRVPRRVEPMGCGEVVQDLVGQCGEGFAGGGRRPSTSERINLPDRDKRCGRPLMHPAADTAATLRSPTGPSGTRGDRPQRQDGRGGPGLGMRARSRCVTASHDRTGADARGRPRIRGCGTRLRSLSSEDRTPAGRRRSRRIRARLRCCIVCDPARSRSLCGGHVRMRNRRTAPPRPANLGFLDGLSGLGGKGYARPLPWRRLCRSGPGPPCSKTRGNCHSTTCLKR